MSLTCDGVSTRFDSINIIGFSMIQLIIIEATDCACARARASARYGSAIDGAVCDGFPSYINDQRVIDRRDRRTSERARYPISAAVGKWKTQKKKKKKKKARSTRAIERASECVDPGAMTRETRLAFPPWLYSPTKVLPLPLVGDLEEGRRWIAYRRNRLRGAWQRQREMGWPVYARG